MDGRVEKTGQEPVGFTQRVRDGAGAAWKAVSGFFGSVGRFIYNHAITVFLILWTLASIGAVLLIMYLADPCRGTNLVCPGVEWIRPGYLAEDFRNLLWAASLVFGGAGAGAALINALRRTRLMHSELELKRSGQDAETFSRAVEQLGSEQTAIRLGAIYALEGLMRTAFVKGGDKAFGRQIGETLAAFVRDQSAQEARKGMAEAEVATSGSTAGAKSSTEDRFARLAVDREAAVVVLVRSWPFTFRPDIYEQGGIDISSARLAYLKIPSDSDLRSFDLTDADLLYAQLFGAKLQGVLLERANLQHARLAFSNLRYAELRGANLESASLEETDLTGADLFDVNLQKADLHLANLENAVLSFATTDDAKFTDACITNASLANIGGVGRTPSALANLASVARWQADGPPKVPDGIDLPHRGDGKPAGDPMPFDDSWMTNIWKGED